MVDMYDNIIMYVPAAPSTPTPASVLVPVPILMPTITLSQIICLFDPSYPLCIQQVGRDGRLC